MKKQETFLVETPEGVAEVSEKAVCVKSSPQVCHRLLKEQRELLLDEAMRLGWKVKKVTE